MSLGTQLLSRYKSNEVRMNVSVLKCDLTCPSDSPVQPFCLCLQADGTTTGTAWASGGQWRGFSTSGQRCYGSGCTSEQQRRTREGRRGPVWAQSPTRRTTRGPVGRGVTTWPPGLMETQQLKHRRRGDTLGFESFFLLFLYTADSKS